MIMNFSVLRVMEDGFMNKEFEVPPAGEVTDEPAPARKEAKPALAAAQIKSVLIIQDDNDIYFEDDQSVPTFMAAFKNMGYQVKIEKSKDTSYSTWKQYKIVVWSCGDDYSAVNDIKSRRMLVDYVTQGGCLLLESGNIAAWCKEFGGETVLNRDFRVKVLHATGDWVYHDVGDLKLKNNHPIATKPNVLPKVIGFTPTNPGDNSGDANAVRILPDATGIYIWSHVAYDGKLVKESITSKSFGLIAYEGKGKNSGRIIYYAFDIDDIDSPDIQQKLIQNSENWLRGGN